MSVSYDSISTTKQYNEICNLLIGRSQSPHPKEEVLDLKVVVLLIFSVDYIDNVCAYSILAHAFCSCRFLPKISTRSKLAFVPKVNYSDASIFICY